MQYELLYIVSASVADDDIGTAETNVRALLEKNGATIVTSARLGKFRFAYPIRKSRYGNYILVNFTAEPASLAKLEEALRLSNDVLRHLILRADEAGGEKFEMVQFAEINLEAKEERPRPRRDRPTEDAAKKAEDIKSGVAALEEKSETPPAADAAAAITDEELEKKLDAALTEKT